MRCNLCPAPIYVGSQDFVIEEAPMGVPGQTWVTYAAHRACHDAANPSQPAPGNPPHPNDDPAVYWGKLYGWR